MKKFCLLLWLGLQPAWAEPPRQVKLKLITRPPGAQVCWGRKDRRPKLVADFLSGETYTLVEDARGLLRQGVSEYPVLIRKPGFDDLYVTIREEQLLPQSDGTVVIDLGSLQSNSWRGWLELHPAVPWGVAGVALLGALAAWQEVLRRRARRFREALSRRVVTSPGDERIGTRICSYWLLQRLGRGGMAEVYRATRNPTWDADRDVALKLLNEIQEVDSLTRARYYQEVRLGSQLRHPNVVLFHEPLEIDGRLGLVMELIRGESLRALMGRGALDRGQLRNLLTQVAEGLDYLHGQGIIHRDLKPENIMITERQTIKLMDFGISLREGQDRLSMSGALTGTLTYMSPEQIEKAPLTAAADQYALGVLCYELLIGHPPFRDEEPKALLLLHLYSDPVPPSYLNDRLNDKIDEVLLKMLAKSPAQRFAGAKQAVEALLLQLAAINHA